VKKIAQEEEKEAEIKGGWQGSQMERPTLEKYKEGGRSREDRGL
jgi:hypothetical protein